MPVLRDLLIETKDGEWGNAEPSDDTLRMRVVRGTDFDNFRFGQVDDVPVRHIVRKHAQRKALVQDDIIIETAGGSKDRPTGRTVLVRSKHVESGDGPFVPASFARFLRVDKNKVCPRFLFWKLQAMYADGTLRKYHTQHTGVARFQFTTFAAQELFEIPARSTQERIASVLCAYDDLIENNTRRIAILEEMARRIFEEWFVHFRAPGCEGLPLVESAIGPIPRGWDILDIKNIIERLSPGTIYRKEDCQRSGRVIVVDQSTDEFLGFHNNSPDHSASSQYPLFIFGDHTRKMQILSSIFSVGQNTVVFRSSKLSPYYIYQLISRVGLAPEYKRHWNDLLKKHVVVAPTALATAFGNRAELFFESSGNLRRQNRNLRSQRDLLLPKLISGEIDVTVVTTSLQEAAE